MDTWKLQDAKNRLSHLVNRTRTVGPQRITRRGKPVAVLVSEEEFTAMTKPDGLLTEFLINSPLHASNLDLKRDRSLEREIDL